MPLPIKDPEQPNLDAEEGLCYKRLLRRYHELFNRYLLNPAIYYLSK